MGGEGSVNGCQGIESIGGDTCGSLGTSNVPCHGSHRFLFCTIFSLMEH